MERQEFRSKLEDLMPAEELLFQPTPGFGPFYEPYLDHAKAHPAKMNTWLLEWLIKAFTKPGETVLDPMAGSGSTGVVAALHARNAVQVELEKKFYDWMEKAKENIEKNIAIQQKGWIKNICGDARRLGELLSQADACITSPPYLNVDNVKRNSEDFWLKAKESGKRCGCKPPFGTEEKQLSKENIGNLPLGEISTVITSPPFGDSYIGGGDPERRRERLIKAGHDPKDFLGGKARNAVLKHYNEVGNVDCCITSPPYSESMTKKRKGYTVIPELQKTREMSQDTSDDNIANLPHGSIDAVITSPPYKTEMQGAGLNKDDKGLALGCKWNGYSKNRNNLDNLEYGNIDEENIGNLPFVDCCIKSPPYESSVSDGKESPLAGADEKKYGRWRKSTARKHSYTEHGEPCKVDTVITSPPYEGSLEGSTRHTRGGIASRDPALAQTGSYATVMSFGVPVGYSPNPENIGNMKKETYLEAMLKVYGEIFRVLKPGGLSIIVVKPFIRNKKVVDLPYHTWLLMMRVGFRLAKLYKLRLKQQSFWRILLYKKHSDVPVIAHEYVLVCQKAGSEPSEVKPQISPLDFIVEMVARQTALKIGA
ncbi:MAG: DNA methyltransferase [Candidatus Bathyarchaeia archaeon]